MTVIFIKKKIQSLTPATCKFINIRKRKTVGRWKRLEIIREKENFEKLQYQAHNSLILYINISVHWYGKMISFTSSKSQTGSPHNFHEWCPHGQVDIMLSLQYSNKKTVHIPSMAWSLSSSANSFSLIASARLWGVATESRTVPSSWPPTSSPCWQRIMFFIWCLCSLHI